MKKVEKKAEGSDDSDDDLFGDDDDDEATKKLQEEMAKKAKKAKKQKEKEANQKSRVVLDIKGYEVGQDFKDLAVRIFDKVDKEGLDWENNAQVLPLAFGMNKLQISMIILNRLVSADWVIEQIETLFEEEV